jgi:transposase
VSGHRRGRAPSDRERLMFSLRVAEGLSLREIGEQFGVGAERVRQLLNQYCRLAGIPGPPRRQRRRDGQAGFG